MRRAVGLAATLLLVTLASALGGCTEGAAGTGPEAAVGAARDRAGDPAARVVAAGAGTDLGNGRPATTYDGLMVRRRVAIAIEPTPGADVVALRRELGHAATVRHTTVSDVSASVLEAADRERLEPDVTVVLPVGATLAQAEDLIDPSGAARAVFPGVRDFAVTPVLVHDLRFSIRAKDPSASAQAIAREGILTDALGSYSTSTAAGRLDVSYTGPLLSDELVEQVRRGMARGTDGQPAAVTVSPRSTTGVGVDLATEPAPAAVPEVAPSPHGHGHVAALPAGRPAPSDSSWFGWWVVAIGVAVAMAVWLGLTLVRETDAEGDVG
ncbi:MAG: hypothetical protein ACJ710_11520 [Ornithinibacter sp.]